MDGSPFSALMPPLAERFPPVLVVDRPDADHYALTATLQREGFSVKSTSDVQEALALLQSFDPMLVLLEMSLPGARGLDVCRSIRERSRVPVIFLATRSTEIDVVLGLEVGADDYVVKPARPRELVARIRAVLRRSSAGRETAAAPEADVVQVGGLRMRRSSYEVWINDQPVKMPLREFRLLETLLVNTGRVVERRELIQVVWGQCADAGKTLDTHIKRLRARIEARPGCRARIRTIRGVGYCFEAVTSDEDGDAEAAGSAG